MDKKRTVPQEKTQPKQGRASGTKSYSASDLQPRIESPDSSLDNGRALGTAEFYACVARKAYELFEHRGCEEGHDVEDWLEAERLVRNDLRQGKP
jgi:hypothetical protein